MGLLSPHAPLKLWRWGKVSPPKNRIEHPENMGHHVGSPCDPLLERVQGLCGLPRLPGLGSFPRGAAAETVPGKVHPGHARGRHYLKANDTSMMPENGIFHDLRCADSGLQGGCVLLVEHMLCLDQKVPSKGRDGGFCNNNTVRVLRLGNPGACICVLVG